jgi:signal transduction histidine kinase
MSDLLIRRRELQKSLLDLFTTTTNIPISLYEITGNDISEMIITETSLSKFEPHCQLLQSFPGGKTLCEQDQCNRAKLALLPEGEHFTMCHAGLNNQVIQIKVRGEVRGSLLFGEMQVEGAENQEAALEKHQLLVEKLNLNDEQAAHLRKSLLEVKKYTPHQLSEWRKILKQVEQWFFTLIDEEERVIRNTEKITHETQTRLQAVIANAENLALECSSLSPKVIAQMATEVLNSAEAVDEVVQNLGDYLGEYRFAKQPIEQIITAAKQLHEAEAARREVEIQFHFQATEDSQSKIEVSRGHLQYALSNLIHNAVKYSFRGGPNRNRYVKIATRADADGYRISITNYGIGILPEEIAKIFDDGYQGKLTKAEYRTGCGKGLFFVKRIIDRHHGRIAVESNLVRGVEDPEGNPHSNRFTIILPYKQPKLNSYG